MSTREPHSAEQLSTLQLRLAEAEGMLRAIRHGEIDALVVEGPGGNQVYTLHSADEPYRTLVEQMQEGAVVLTARGDILYANLRFAALVGEPLESVVGSRIDRFVQEPDRRDTDALLSRGIGRCRSRLVRSDSQSVAVSLSVTTTPSPAGDRRNLIVTDLSDLLEAHSTRDLAQRENRTKDEFLATFAHELRSPLGAISAAAHLLEVTRAAGGAGSTRPHEIIVRQVNHIARLIDDLLDVERIVSGKVRLNRQPVDIADAARQVVAAFSAATVDRRITLSTVPVWVDWDAVRLQQVLTNLVTNAIKYTPAGGQIQVAVRAEDDDAVVTVADTGYGISAALLPVIFDMFVQVGRTLDHAKEGLGIGLALVRHLVELHGGAVAAASDGEGRGSTFTLRLRQIAAPDQSVATSFPRERRTTQRRVLLIEDSGQARERLRAMLELAGHVVYDAADVGSGLELVRTFGPDVGIIDVSSQMMDRRLVARRFRDEPHGRKMMLVAVCPPACPSEANGPLEDGFDFHLAEPVDVEHLFRLLGDDAQPASANQ